MLEVILNCHKLKSSFSQKITVTTNDPDHPTETLICKGQILDAVSLSPKRINFGSVSRKAPVPPQTVTITRGDAGPLNLKLRPVESESLVAQLREIEPGERYELEVTLSPPFKSNKVRAKVIVETGIAKAPTASIPVYASLAPRLEAQPRNIRVPGQLKADWQQVVRLVWDDDVPHKIIGATVNDPKLTVEVDDQDGRHQVIVQVPAGYTLPGGRRTVVIKTDDPRAPEVKVPLTVTRGASRARAGHSAIAPRAAQNTRSGKATQTESTKRKGTPAANLEETPSAPE